MPSLRNRGIGRLTVYILTLAVIASCHKTKPKQPQPPPPVNTELARGYGSSPDKINGYFYAGYQLVYPYTTNKNYCTFRDPASNLMASFNHYTELEQFLQNNLGNVNVGQVSFNGQSLQEDESSSIAYNSFSNAVSFDLIQTARWNTDGNGSFKPIDLTIPNGFPLFLDPSTPAYYYTATRNQDFTIDLSHVVTNFDSLVIEMGNPPLILRKVVTHNATSITFTKSELQLVSALTEMDITFMAYNYYNKTIEDKVYVFELSYKLLQKFLFTS